jgi:NAD(P)-dependent dehydrogenase (short-subunit alcohol dehydrogenase family)
MFRDPEGEHTIQSLKGKIGLVTGASRGGGRGIALALGDAGATVYVTGRSVAGHSTRPDLPGTTVTATAEQVTARGGLGIAVQCDHTADDQVEALFDRIKRDQGRLDVLVNNIWGGYEHYDAETFDVPFWEQPLWRWDKMFAAGVRAHFTASRLAAPLMIARRQGLIINTTAWDRGKYLGSLPYFVAKTAVNRMAYGMALELRVHNIAAVALAPGWMRTEDVLFRFDTDEEHWHEVPELRETESPEYVGRAVAALAADPDVMLKSGQVLMVGDLAREYSFTDIDGRRVPPFRIPGEYLID